MGLLDDAIREHLELKRKHGAAEEEVERQESEALGPARRDLAAAQPAAEPVAEPVPADDAVGDYEPAAWLDEEEALAPEPPPPVEPPPATAPPTAVEPPAAAEPPRPVEPPPAAPAAELRDEPPSPREEPPAAVPPRQSDTPTQGFDALSREDLEEPEGEEPEEDVLEETPDFLQETPEHDRLWFEQKPPRDFDFDG